MSASDPNAPSLFRRKGCWLTFATAIPLLLGIAWVVEDFAGKRYLAETRARVVAEGLVLDPDKILPARLPDAENFCAIPLLVALGSGSVAGSEWNAMRQISTWHDSFPLEGKRAYASQDSPTPTDWQRVVRVLKKKDKASGLGAGTENAVSDLATVIDARIGSTLAELEAALDRPVAIMLPPLRETMATAKPFDSIVWFQNLRALGSAESFRVKVALAAGDTDRAVRGVLVLNRLAEAGESYGTLVASLVGVSLRGTAARCLWVGLRDRAFERAQQQRLRQALTGYDGLKAMQFAFRTETLEAQRSFTLMGRDPAPLANVYGGDRWQILAYGFIPNGWWGFNQANHLHHGWEWIKRLENGDDPGRFVRSQWLVDELAGLRRGFPYHNLLVPMTLGTAVSAASSMATTHAVIHLAEVACALEEWFTDHQSYPETLDALVPKYLPAVPLDFDRKPIRYRQEPTNGRYALWSIGLDGIDDGGVEKTESGKGKPRAWREPVGDWVWRYP